MLAGLLSLSLLVTPLAAWANPHGSLHHNRHVEIAKRQTGDVQLFKRFSDTRWTFYDVGLGACGEYNVASDFIVALNSAQYGGGYPGPHCFKQITMTFNGKTTTATIMDECPGCPYGGLDLSRGLFKFFASESVGVLSGDWYFSDGSGGGGDPPPKTSKYVAPTTSTKQTPKPTTTWTPDPTTYWTPDPTPTTTKKTSTSTSYTPSTTSSSASSSHSSSVASSSSSKASSSSSSVPASSSSAAPSATPPSKDSGHNLAALGQSFLDLGVLVVAAA